MEVGVFCIVDDNMDKQEASEIVGLEYKSYGKENIMKPQAKQKHKTTYTCMDTHVPLPITSLIMRLTSC